MSLRALRACRWRATPPSRRVSRLATRCGSRRERSVRATGDRALSSRPRVRHPRAAFSGAAGPKSGPSSSYAETWDGKYDMETQGMWDVAAWRVLRVTSAPRWRARRGRTWRRYTSRPRTRTSAANRSSTTRCSTRSNGACGRSVATPRASTPRCSRQGHAHLRRPRGGRSADGRAVDVALFAALGALLIALDVRDAIEILPREGFSPCFDGVSASGARGARRVPVAVGAEQSQGARARGRPSRRLGTARAAASACTRSCPRTKAREVTGEERVSRLRALRVLPRGRARGHEMGKGGDGADIPRLQDGGLLR